jgi:hypothetical protein
VASSLDPLVALRTALAATGSPTGTLGDWLAGNDDDDLLVGAAWQRRPSRRAR